MIQSGGGEELMGERERELRDGGVMGRERDSSGGEISGREAKDG